LAQDQARQGRGSKTMGACSSDTKKLSSTEEPTPIYYPAAVLERATGVPGGYVPVAGSRPACRLGEDCPDRCIQAHTLAYAHPGDTDYSGPRKACRFGLNCHDHDERHRRRFSHPGDADEIGAKPRRRACKFGLKCFRRSGQHLSQFAHPGDMDYRRGQCCFDEDAQPEFETLRQLFDFCDPHLHGNFTNKENLKEALLLLVKYVTRRSDLAQDVDHVWRLLEGERQKFVGFPKFAAWAQEIGISLPIGIEVSHKKSDGNFMSCGFVYPDGRRCTCLHFEEAPAEDAAICPKVGASPMTSGMPLVRQRSSMLSFCKCGHKKSLHVQRITADSTAPMAPVPEYWAWAMGADQVDLGQQGDLMDLGQQGVAIFQHLFDKTHKTQDNWTRDRGCSKHGLKCGATDPMCAFRNKKRVPSGYRVIAVTRNMNRNLWGYYALNRGAIARECEMPVAGQPFKAMSNVSTVGTLLEDTPMVDSCNEWFLFHGASQDNCLKICQENFNLAHAGTGATWKDASGKGRSLYGHGVYFADRITKADEYSDEVPFGNRYAGCHTLLISRVIGGRTQYCDTNEINTEALQKQVIQGPFHSVFGDRVTKLKKPYREFVVYDSMQCYPEYIVYYNRLYA